MSSQEERHVQHNTYTMNTVGARGAALLQLPAR